MERRNERKLDRIAGKKTYFSIKMKDWAKFFIIKLGYEKVAQEQFKYVKNGGTTLLVDAGSRRKKKS